jgi:pSer/pThr/pTyr-binding forkhead associated (FHA) protein
MPFALVGRDDGCDVTLTDPEVNPRHAWLQVVGGRALAVDLGSRAGLDWPGQGTGSGWLDVGVPVRIGQFQIRLCSPVSPRPTPFAPRYSPLQSDPGIVQRGSSFTLEFRNGKRARDRWTVNRLITLVGRASECKIRLSADDIAAFHCGLVLTPESLWVVDLSGRGVVVNGERMRVSQLEPGSDLWIGRFLIGLHGKSTIPNSQSVCSAAESNPRSPAELQSASPVEPAEDEVPLGLAPPRDPQAGLPSSHIMADAFQMWDGGQGGSMSNPILVSGSSPAPMMHPVDLELRSAPQKQPIVMEGIPAKPTGRVEARSADRPAQDATGNVAALLRQLAELHGQLLAQFEQSLGLMVRLFAYLSPEQLTAMQRELARIQELNSELGPLQAEVARRAADVLSPILSARPSATPSASQPLDSTALHDLVTDRISSLQRERQARWQSLVGMFSSSETR